MDCINFICKECSNANSKQCMDEYTEGYVASCDRCNEKNIICRFQGCKTVFGPTAGKSSRKKPWTYFLSHHYRRKHERNYNWRKRKAENDLQSQSHLAVSMCSVRESTDENNDSLEEDTEPENQSKETEVQAVTEETNDAMEHEISNELDFGDGNGMDSLECTGLMQLDDCFAVNMQDVFIEEMPPDLEDRTANNDDSSVDSDETSKSEDGITDDCQLLGLPSTFFESIMGEQEKADDDVDDIYQSLITEFACADIDPEAVNDNYDEHQSLPDTSNKNCDNNCDSSITSTIDQMYSDMEKIYDKRSGEERMFRRGSSIVALSQVALYFTQKHCMLQKDHRDHFGGYRGLVQRCQTRNRNEKYTMADKAESLAVFLYHMLVLSVTESDQELLIRYEKEKMELLGMTDQKIRSATTFQFPRSSADVRRDISQGAFSIMKNFPVQRVFSIAGHACVSLRETFCIAAGHYGGFVFPWDGSAPEGMERNTDGINGCLGVKRVCWELINSLRANGRDNDEIRRMQLGWITIWSDSFLNSFIKQKDNSVWLLTATVCPPYDQTNSDKFKFVLAMGKSSLDHSEVINHYLSEIEGLKEGFMYYSADVNDYRKCAMGLLSYIADRPERSSVRGTRQEGHFGRVTDWATDISSKYFPACKDCYIVIVKVVLGKEKLSKSTPCKKCCCWAIDENHNAEFYHRTSKKYPRKIIQGRLVPKGRSPGVRHIGPKRMSSKWLQVVCKYAYDARRLGLWTKENFEEYLRTCNVRDETVQAISKVAENDRKSKIESDISEYIPKVWLQKTDLFANRICFDAPMHCFCHGVIVDCMNALHEVLAKWKRLTNYIEVTNETLSAISLFNLEWLKVKRLPKAAWVGENTMAYTRLMSYCYGYYFLNHTTSNNDEQTLLCMKRMVNTLQSVASMIMSKGTLDGEKIEVCFKLLLSNAQHLEQQIGSFVVTEETTSSSNKEVVVNYNPGELWILLTALGRQISNTDNVISMRKKLSDIKKDALFEELKKLHVTVPQGKNVKKTILQQTLFTAILAKHTTLYTKENDNAQPQEKSVSEKASVIPYYLKGNWVSMVINIKGFIEEHESVRDNW